MPTTDTSNPGELLAECDKCVMCGLCLPHCPTYQLNLDENESPRGRISLARALLSGQLQTDERMNTHIAHCLGCRACERMCPSGVKFASIIDGIREQLPRQPLPMPVSDKTYLQKLNRQARLAQTSGILKIVRSTGLAGNGELARKLKLLPAISKQKPWAQRYDTAEAKKGQVELFTGCINDAIDQKSLRDSVDVLNRLGYDVLVPAEQGCCGAMDLHRGNRQEANELGRQNRQAFSADTLAVISLQSGCSTRLLETLDKPVMDLCDFLVEHEAAVEFAPLKKRVVIHSPCSKKNVLRNEANVKAVLSRIPGIDLVELPSTLPCCGSGGSYMLDFPEQADAIRQPTLASVKESAADILVSSNIGCAMHLQAGIREDGVKIKVMHPAKLIAKQLVRGEE